MPEGTRLTLDHTGFKGLRGMIVSGIPGKGCSFEVRELSGGTSRIVFDYRTMAKRKGCRASHGTRLCSGRIDFRHQG